jgi:hypothetical protein
MIKINNECIEKLISCNVESFNKSSLEKFHNDIKRALDHENKQKKLDKVIERIWRIKKISPS